jgi:hypothetical protein
VALKPEPVPELIKLLARTRSSTDPDRRALLVSKGYAVPNEKGQFQTPGHEDTEEAEKKNDELEWLSGLYDLQPSPALSDLLIDIAVIRALAASQTTAGADAILEFAFADDGVAYRDECGRQLRHMAPWSLPALIRHAEAPKEDKGQQRYARYQLERLDRENPRKAFNDAPTDALAIEILQAFSDTLYREAVFVVLENVDHVSPAVRAAARAAWMQYATGRMPPPAPKEKLNLPGGKQSDKPVPLWLTSRELADISIRRKLEELTGKKVPERARLADLSKQLFDFYDARRTAALDKDLAAGLAAAKTGDLAGAAQKLDAILVQEPNYARRGDMAQVYLDYGESLVQASKWREASRAFGKANAVAPEGPLAGKALQRHHEARGRALESEGKSGAVEMARASEIRADLARAAVSSSPPQRWMLFAGIGGGVGGLLLLAIGLAWRRRHG